MLVVYLQKSWSSRTQIPLVAEESLSQKLGCTLISFTDFQYREFLFQHGVESILCIVVNECI